MDAGDDPYKILGVATDATEADIKKAYRKLALKHHPDKNPNDPNAHSNFAKISNAYELLADNEERKYYDWEHGTKSNNGNNNNRNNSASFGGGMPFQSTKNFRPKETSTSSSSSFRPQEKQRSHTFHDPFSVFEDVFREEFDDNFFPQHTSKMPASSTSTSKSSSDAQDGPPSPGGRQVSMQTAMKTINGKSVTVTEHVYEMPDGTLQTRIDKEVKAATIRTNPSEPTSNRTSCFNTFSGTPTSNNKPLVTTKIVNGVKETTTEYADGRTETKCEPLDNINKTPGSRNMPTPVSKKDICNNKTNTTKIHTNGDKCNKQVHVTTQIENGVKETTTHYPDGRSETKCEPLNSSDLGCTPAPTCRPVKTSLPIAKQQYQPKQRPAQTTTKIVDGMKETTTRYPDGRTETKMEMVTGAASSSPGIRISSTSTTTSASRPKTKAMTTSIPKTSSSGLMLKFNPQPASTGGANSTSRQTTHIVNGKKEITTEHTITHPDGTTETRIEKRIEAS
jgi:curved DNA-binding protein CbpA